jgi:hypothetical protein
LKGDASVVLEGSDGLEEIDKFLGDKVCNLCGFISTFFIKVHCTFSGYLYAEV